ncbi:MAG: SecDF P1 head subdomain-containing protein [Planctomycetota bacterium]
MQLRKLLVLTIFYFISLANSLLSGQQQDSWTVEFRIAANATEDAAIVELGKSSKDKGVYREGQLVGKWVEVLKSTETALEKKHNLVTRRSEQRGLELLVLTTPDDVNESDVRRISPSKDRLGRLALMLEFDDKGSSKIFNMTKKCAYREPQRYVATIMDNKVTSIPMVSNPVSRHAQITGDFDESLIEDIRQRSPKGFVRDIYSEPPPYAITVTPWRLAAFLVVAIVVIVGSLPSKGLTKSRHPKVWTISATIIGIFIGAYVLGVTRTSAAGMTVAEDWRGITGEVIQIALLWIVVGGVIGAGLGFLLGRACRFFVRRAVHNVTGLVFKRNKS